MAVAAEPRARHDLGLAEGVVTWVTSGTRLAQEVSSEWLQAVLGTLARHPDCRWLIVGRGHDQVAGLPAAHPQILRREFDDQLPSLFKACDIYLNPPRLGGGHSVVTAMAQGLPVLSLRDSDGGDKLGPAACNDLADYFQALERLAGDSAARAQLGRQARERYLETLDLGAGAAGLVQALQALVSGSPLARA